jgi:hypothetical protein
MSSPARPTRKSGSIRRPGPRTLARRSRDADRQRLIRRLVIATGIAIPLGLVGLVVWHRINLGSPTHALVSIQSAFHDHDGTRLAYYADVDAIATQVADQGIDWMVVQHRRATLAALRDEVHDIGTAPDSSQRVQLLKMALAEHGGQGAAAALAGGTTDSANVAERMTDAFQALPPIDAMLGTDHLDFVALGKPRRLGASFVVPVTLEYRELGETVTVSLLMSHAQNRWKLVGLEDFDETLSAIDNAQLERLASRNRPVQARLEEMLVLGTPVVTRIPIGRHRDDMRLQIPIRNASPFAVRQVTVLLGARGSDDEHGEMLTLPLGVAPGATVMATWQFEETRNRTSRAAWLTTHTERMSLVPRGAVYDSAGTAATLELFHTYAEARRGRAAVHSPMDSTDSAP